MKTTRILSCAAALAILTVFMCTGSTAWAQDFEDEEGEEVEEDPFEQPLLPGAPSGSRTGEDWSGAVRILRIPGASGVAEARAATEIFPEADKVWLRVDGTDPVPIEGARRGAREWICSGGCEIGDGGSSRVNQGDSLLVSIKASTPATPLPLTLWRRRASSTSSSFPTPSGASTSGQLMFDPTLLGRRSYRHHCAYAPVKARAALGSPVPKCVDSPHQQQPTPHDAELHMGFQWPATSELASFEYLAVVDTCGNAWVQPFQRYFTVPVYLVSSGGCKQADGKVLRVFPTGGWLRVTAFNLDTPAAGQVVSATFRVTVPPMQDLVSPDNPAMLFPDVLPGELLVDCAPKVLKSRTETSGEPVAARPKAGLPGQTPPPGRSLPGQTPPPGRSAPKPPAAAPLPKDADAKDAPRVPVVRRGAMIPTSAPEGQPLAHQGLVIGPEPLLQGNCRIEYTSQHKRRLIAPLALRVRMSRTDPGREGVVFEAPWIITRSYSTFHVPSLAGKNFSGESRLRLEVFSDPLSGDGNTVLLSDAGRMARVRNAQSAAAMRRLVGSVTLHSAPLCGGSNFETIQSAGTCVRGYFTVPAMLATLQITRAPWVERPLVTRQILSAVGVAFALDSYDPVERAAFPIAFQVGGFVQNLGEDRIGLLSYVGVAPTIPILGDGGNTTSIGLLAGIGMNYVTNSNGPDEGFKPSAFLSVVVQVGQANPAAGAGAQQSFGQFQGGTVAPPPPPGGFTPPGGYADPSEGYENGYEGGF